MGMDKVDPASARALSEWRTFGRVLAKHKRLLVAVPLLAAVVAAGVLQLVPNQYTAVLKIAPPPSAQLYMWALRENGLTRSIVEKFDLRAEGFRLHREISHHDNHVGVVLVEGIELALRKYRCLLEILFQWQPKKPCGICTHYWICRYSVCEFSLESCLYSINSSIFVHLNFLSSSG